MAYYADTNIGRNVLRRVEVIEVDDSGPIQKITCVGLADEYFEFPLRGQGHGMTSNPKVGALGYVMMANGRPDQAFLMGLEHPDERPVERKPGESTMYASKKQRVHMDENGDADFNTPDGVLYINTRDAE